MSRSAYSTRTLIPVDNVDTGGTAGTAASGDAIGGNSDGFGSGGNAYSGHSGNSNGGFVANEGTNDILNTDSSKQRFVCSFHIAS